MSPLCHIGKRNPRARDPQVCPGLCFRLPTHKLRRSHLATVSFCFFLLRRLEEASATRNCLHSAFGWLSQFPCNQERQKDVYKKRESELARGRTSQNQLEKLLPRPQQPDWFSLRAMGVLTTLLSLVLNDLILQRQHSEQQSWHQLASP